MVTVIPESLKNLWNEWNLRVAVLFSLMLQIFLIFAATSRKRRGPGLLSILVWVAYLMADWVAAFSVGLISSGVGNDCPDEFKISTQIAGFWAPFLLLHLGGPDSITAFSLEDNELWIRHLFGLLIQLIAVIYVFLVSLNDDFFLPTLLVLLAGAFKYGERTRSLYVACLGNFKDSLLPKPDAGPNYAQLMEEYRSREEANVPVSILIEQEVRKIEDHPEPDKKNMEEIDVVQNSFRFYNTFRGLIVDHMLSFQERDESRKYFFKRNPNDAFRVMEVELNFMYDALYTKTSVVHHWAWYTLRFTCSVLLLVSVVLFMFNHKHKIHRVDISISYTLLLGALVLDLVGHLKLVFSDWTIASLKKEEDEGEHTHSRFVRYLIRGRHYLSLTLTSRWCEIIPRHSLMNYCVRPRSKWFEKVIAFIGVKPLLDEWKYKMFHYWKNQQSRWYEKVLHFIGAKFLLDEQKYKLSKRFEDEELKKFIYYQIRKKAIKASNIISSREISSARGELALLEHPCHYPHELIKRSVSADVEFDESVLLWHIATELCYYHEGNVPGGIIANSEKELCMLLSEYLVYLLIMRPTMMSAVAGIAQIRFQDTCAEARRFLDNIQSYSIIQKLEGCLTGCFNIMNKPRKLVQRVNRSSKNSKDDFEDMRKHACNDLLSVKTVTKPAEVKGDRSKSVLFDGCMLANELMEIHESKRWVMMSEIWMELICYAACHCRANTHAQQLSKGGELITFVWLLMAHFGLGEQFRIQAGHARAKLIVDK